MATIKRIDDVVELLGLIQPENVIQDSFQARRGAPVDDDDIGQGVKFNLGFDGGTLSTSFGFKFVMEDCSFYTDHTVVWAAEEQISISGACMADFLERVAFMTVFPYFREAISTFATRLRVPVPTVGLVRQGTVDLQIDPVEMDEFLKDYTIGPPATEPEDE
ncbi:hypothetical protein [Sinomonas atrocyanea]|uniref:hypothetical protein n=1 Tax=Sinomonas atrocyanea TaxID=37927 RepID=UPI0027838BD4|nr:hypothetical protein [Sinomonas atrocyanea]MDQ0259541.1 hypothetical protein [Sinomonas atrocyanea]MDR6623200.1 hypothetical protein [Sinomonas atrocyanea]